MRLAIISDIHGNLFALEAAIQDLESVGEVDLIWCLGDLAAWGTGPAECVARVRELQEKYGDKKFKLIGGNTDRYIVAGQRPVIPPARNEEGMQKRQVTFAMRDDILNWSLAQLSWEDYEFMAKSLNKELRKRVEGYGDVIGFHAIPGDDDSIALRPDAPEEESLDALLDRAGRLAIGGHTHFVMDKILGDWRVINPGSVGLSMTDPNFAEWALITFDGDEAQIDFRKVPCDFQQMIDEMEAVNYPHPQWILNFKK
jgi:predicted phosphodiesterase